MKLENLLFFRYITRQEYIFYQHVENFAFEIPIEHQQSLIDLARQCEKDSSLFGNLCFAMRISPPILLAWLKVRKLMEQ